ncbi:hypothetical protein [Streptomyces sp. NBC_01262]|uniref:hypothetical protein n=1 Tax=Streptomyces sp. NBC_01262 TaxID=2903803 RepID=UPI002E2F4206|nr:hypothetical protein [Streptomyces sp. NBC_01262]
MMGFDPARVVLGECEVPREILLAMSSGEWAFPVGQSSIASLADVFTDVPTSGARLYSLLGMVQENSYWWSESEEQAELYGASVPAAPGYEAVLPAQSMLVGDLGHDMPIALHYALPTERPRVMYLPAGAPGWIEVAADVAEFLRVLRR